MGQRLSPAGAPNAQGIVVQGRDRESGQWGLLDLVRLKHRGSQGCPGSQLGVPGGGYLELAGPLQLQGLSGPLLLLLLLLLLLQGIELLLPQELGPGVDGELAGVLHVGGGAPAPIHGGPQRSLVHDISCGQGQKSGQLRRRQDDQVASQPSGPPPALTSQVSASHLSLGPWLDAALLPVPQRPRGLLPSSDPLLIPPQHANSLA